MWYKDEGRDSRTFVSESPDLHRWSPGKPAAADIACEGPKVFQWHDRYWMVTDEWRGLAVFQSPDCERWARQPANILEAPGTGLDDMFTGRHADVVVNGGRAYVFYFTHPGRVEGRRPRHLRHPALLHPGGGTAPGKRGDRVRPQRAR